MVRLHFLIFLLVLAFHLSGQLPAEMEFDHYTIETGLSNNNVTGITQDTRGYVWIGTTGGLNRFDGSRFVQFHNTDDSLSLPAENVAGLAWLDKYRLAVLTAGLHIIDTRTGSMRNLFIPYHNLQYQYKFNMFAGVRGDENGHIYILTRSGFYHYDQNYKMISRFDYYGEAEVPVEHFYFGRDLFELDSRRLLMTTVNGLYIYDKIERKVKKMTEDDCPLMAELLPGAKGFYSFFQPKRGCFFIHKANTDTLICYNTIENTRAISRLPPGIAKSEFLWRSRLKPISDTTFYLTSHKAGFFKGRFHPASGTIQLYPEKYFDSYLCTSLLTDKDNGLWITTTRGVFRKSLQKSQAQTAMLPAGMQVKSPDTKVDDIHVSDDKIYAALRGGAGLMVYNKKTLQPEKQVLHKKIPGANNITALASLNDSILLLGTAGPLVLFNQKTEKLTEVVPPKWNYANDWTNDIYKDRKGNALISSALNFRYDPGSKTFQSLPNHPSLLSVPVAIEEDTAGNIWMAGHGLARYNPSRDTFDLVLDSFPYIRMPDRQITAMQIDNRNRVWFSCYNNGLAAYDIKTGTFQHFTRKHGLPDNCISSMIIVENKLWMGCCAGIACMDLESFKITSFGKEDGFPDTRVVRGARFFYDKEFQQLYMGFTTGFTRFNPHEILAQKSPPQVFVESLLINGQANTFLPGKQVTTSWHDNEVRVTIGTINFSDGNSQRFAYRILKDTNTNWSQIGSEPSFNLSNLSPGTHQLQVKVYSPNNRWPEQLYEMSIMVLPPLWRETWFIILTLAVVLAVLYFLIKWRIGLIKKKEMEKTHIQKLKADHYKSQLELEQISNYFTSSLSGKKTKEEVLWDVAENLIGQMNYEDCVIYLWNADKTKMIQKAAFGPKGKPELISTSTFDVLPGQGIVGHVMQSLQPIVIDDARKDIRYRVDDAFRLSELCVPIIHHGELLGIIDSEHTTVNYFSDRDVKILTTIATLLANKLKQIESEQSLDANRKELNTINEQLAEARLSALQSQMNPHFVFNALNSIKWMILDGDNEKASRYLSKFAQMIRMTLDHSKDVFVTLDENIQYLRSYLEMEQLRFDESFTYTIDVAKNIEATEITIPSMMIQPLVENAIWHGLMQAKTEKKILISFTEEDNTITCTVEDNGIGIRRAEKAKEKTSSPHRSVGLENLRKRLKIMNEKYDMNCRLVITDLKETDKKLSGTRVVLQFNLVNA